MKATGLEFFRQILDIEVIPNTILDLSELQLSNCRAKYVKNVEKIPKW